MCQLKEDKHPLVSIVAVCYNHEKFVEETLNSVIAQTYSQVELIIIDDCSADGSAQVINQWVENHKKGCQFIVHQKNKGLCASLNEALLYVKGKYVQIISCDDVLASTKIEKQVEYLEANSDDVLCCSDFRTIDESGAVIKDRYFHDDYDFPDDPFSAILEGHEGLPIVVHSPTALVRKSSIDKVGSYPEDLLQEDFFMWLNLALHGPFGFLCETLVDYRRLSTSLSAVLTISQRIEYLEGHIKVIDSLVECVDSIRKKILIKAKIARIGKVAKIRLGDGVIKLDDVEIIVDKSKKMIISDCDSARDDGNKVISEILYLAWKRGRKIKKSELYYLLYASWRHRLKMLLSVPLLLRESKML